MTKTTKIVLAGGAGLVSGYLLAMLTAVAKLLSLGKTAWDGDVRLLFVPVAHIQNDAHGFVMRSSYGVFMIAAFGAVVAVGVMLYHLKGRQTKTSAR